jgi:hypothetical protein
VPSQMSMNGDAATRRLDQAVVLDLEGREISLRSVYEKGAVVLVWLRHYG